MKKVIIEIILLFAFSTVYAQKLIPVSTIGFFNLTEKIESRKTTSVSIEISDSTYNSFKSIGSGFLTIKNGKAYAITNFHVIKATSQIDVLMVGFNIDDSKMHSKVEDLFVDQRHDIAVLDIGLAKNFQNRIVKDSTLSETRSIGISVYEKSKDIVEGIGIFTVGYPLGLGSEYHGNKPMVRIGIVSQRTNLNTNTFFIDGVSSHGNSGSPVFNAQNGNLLGMVVGFPNDHIMGYDESGQVIVRLPYNSGLTLCVTAEKIWQVIP